MQGQEERERQNRVNDKNDRQKKYVYMNRKSEFPTSLGISAA